MTNPTCKLDCMQSSDMKTAGSGSTWALPRRFLVGSTLLMLEVPRPSPVSHKTSRRRGFSEFQDLPSLLDVGDRHGNHEARWRKLL